MKRLMLSFVFFLVACSGESVTFHGENADEVSVKAYIVRENDSLRKRRKADTLLPTDSIILLAVIEPSRSIRMTQFYWQIDSGETHSEFSHRTFIPIPGKHSAKFILLDRFSDTLRDSVAFWIAPNPVLDTNNWIPRNGTRDIPPDSAVSFAWNATIDNPLAETLYSFSLRCGKEIFLDTVLAHNRFTCEKKLPELELCDFAVSASDDFSKTSPQKIQSIFFTGTSLERKTGNVFIQIESPVLDSLKFLLFDFAGIAKRNFFPTSETRKNLFSIRDLEPGDYKLLVQSEAYPDYVSDTAKFSVRGGNVSLIEKVSVRDTVAPQISSHSGKDSLDWKDSLPFRITENGLPLSPSDIRILFDGTEISDWIFENGNLRIFTGNLQPAFSSHPLTISVRDRAGNSASANFTVAPGKSCVETLSDTTLSVGASIAIPIKNICPGIFPKRFLWDIDADGHWDGEALFDSSQTVSKTFSHSLFQKFPTEVRVQIQYAGGEEFEGSFTILSGDAAK